MPKAKIVINVAGPELRKIQETSKAYYEHAKQNNKESKSSILSSHRGGKYRRKTHKIRKSHKSNRNYRKSHKSNRNSRKSHKRTKKGRK